jgi:hypothetical protein
MFDHGVDLLGGLIVDDTPSVWRAVAEGGQKALFSQGGRMVKVTRDPAIFGQPATLGRL